MDNDPRRSKTVVGLLLLASLTVIALDAGSGSRTSPIQPLRSAVGDVMGPVENSVSTAVHPITDIPHYFGDVSGLHRRNADLQRQNAALRTRLRAAQANTYRGTEVRAIGEFAATRGYRIVQAQVVAMGAAQSFSRTVTIDAGTADGVHPDQTVLNANGLVGRVLSSSAHSATVLLVVDRESTVGGRLAGSMQLGFVQGTGSVSGDGLTLSLVDPKAAPRPGETVLTWGSSGHAPYLPGIPIGRVVSVRSTPSELTETAVVRPFADVTALDVVGIIVGRGQAPAGSGGGAAEAGGAVK